MNPIVNLPFLAGRIKTKLFAAALLSAGLFQTQTASALTVTTTTANGSPAHEVQWTDSAGLARTAIMVDQTTNGPGYLYSLTYQYNGSPRTCAGTGITRYTGDGFVENHNTQDSDNNSLDDSTPGTTTITLQGSSHAIIQYSMPTYKILGAIVPTTICWFFADGRSNPIFAISQDARTSGGNLGADTRSPYGSLNFDGTADGESDLGGASYGDTLKFVTLASDPEQVTGLSGWSDNTPNTIPYAMEWIDPAEVDAEMGHVATVPITVQDEGKDRDQNSTLDPRNSQALTGPMIPYGATLANGANGPDAWSYQLLDYILHPDYQGDGQGASGSVQASYAKLAWAGNYGRVGGYNDGNNSLSGTNYSQHYNSSSSILTGTRVSGMLMAYSVFEVLGAHNGSYTNGAVGQTVVQMQNSAQTIFSATIGSVATTGPAGVGNATNATVTYSPAGFNPAYATWEISAVTNTINATLAVALNYPLDHPIFLIDNYTSNSLPASIAVGAGYTNSGVNYFASLDTGGHHLWITVNRLVTNSLNLVIKYSLAAATQPAPVISAISPTNGLVGAAVTITGQNFTNASAVTFNGVTATPFTVVSATQITTTVPVGATTGPVSVTTPGGTAQSAANFFVTLLAPTIASFNPVSGAPGTSVTITGLNLTNATAVSFNGTGATPASISATQITVAVPAGATTGPISVTTPGGTVTTTTNFTVLTPPSSPSIQSYPSSGAVGTPIVITGLNFTGATNVSFAGTSASFTVNSATQITATVPAGAASGFLSVSTAGGTAYSISGFTPLSPPIITAITAEGTVGMVIPIIGLDFTGATNVSFNGMSASFTVNADTQITAVVPAGATPGPISISTSYGTGESPAPFIVLVGAITNLPVYVDGLLNNFMDYSWATNVNDYNTSPVFAGSDSISVTGSAFTALSLYHTNFNTAPYASLSFWINGGAAGASGLQVMGTTGNGSSQAYANIIDLPPLAKNTWTQFNISMAELGVANVTNCEGFWFWPTLSGATTFYVDSIQLDYAINVPTLALLPPATKPGSLVLQLGGSIGQPYWLQTSTNLTTWTSIGTNTLTSTSLNITNAIAPGSGRLFFRAVLP